MIKFCAYCKKDFKSSPSENKKYCDLNCRNRGYTFRQFVRKCEWCFVWTEQKRARIKRFCSKRCKKEWYHHKKMEKWRRYCDHCLSAYWIDPRSRKNRKYCSIKCFWNCRLIYSGKGRKI